MPKILGIKKGRNKYTVTVENNEILNFRVSEDFLVENNILKAKEISLEEYSNFLKLVTLDDLYQKCLKYVLMKQRTKLEITAYLKKYGLNKQDEKFIIDKLNLLGLIDDKRYAHDYIYERINFHFEGYEKIKFELINKGIEEELINKVYVMLAHEEETIEKIIRGDDGRFFKGAKQAYHDFILKKVINKGFNYNIASNLIDKYISYENISEDKNLNKELMKLKRQYQGRYDSFELNDKIIKSLLKKGYRYQNIREEMEKGNEDK